MDSLMVLKGARAALLERGWTQSRLEDRETGAVCLMGAIHYGVLKDPHRWIRSTLGDGEVCILGRDNPHEYRWILDATAAVLDTLGEQYSPSGASALVSFNDSRPADGGAQVLAVIDLTIARLEAERATPESAPVPVLA